MIRRLLIVLLIVLITSAIPAPLAASAQEESTPQTSTKVNLKRKVRHTGFHQTGVSFLMWQEQIKGTKSTVASDTRTQSQGIQFRYGYNIPFRNSRWRHAYLGDLGFGTLKGTVVTSGLADELRNQYWISSSLTPALIYETTDVSDLGIGAPMTLRLIRWNLQKEGDLLMDRTSSFSPGLSLLYMNRFTVHHILNFTFTHQFAWKASQWAVGYDYRF